jgi:hypothetical protein
MTRKFYCQWPECGETDPDKFDKRSDGKAMRSRCHTHRLAANELRKEKLKLHAAVRDPEHSRSITSLYAQEVRRPWVTWRPPAGTPPMRYAYPILEVNDV